MTGRDDMDTLTVPGRDGGVYVLTKFGEGWSMQRGGMTLPVVGEATAALCDALLAARRECDELKRALDISLTVTQRIGEYVKDFGLQVAEVGEMLNALPPKETT